MDKGNTTNSITHIGQKISFSSDSPLFAKRINHYGNDLEKLGEFLKLMVKQMRQVCKDVEIGSKSFNELGNAMRTGISAADSHPTLIPIVKQFGDICSEIAATQVILAESLDKCFIQPLENFYTNDVAMVLAMKQHYHNQREGHDALIQKYLQSDASNFGRGTNQSQLDLRAFEVVQQKKRVEITRFDFVKKINEVEAKKSFEVAECCVSALYAMRTHYHQCADVIQSSKSTMDELSRKQQNERKLYESMLEQQRRDGGDETKIEMLNILDGIITRVKSLSPFLQMDTAASLETSCSPDSQKQHEQTLLKSHTQATEAKGSELLTSGNANSNLYPTQSYLNFNKPSSLGGGPNNANEQQSSFTRLSRIGAFGANIIGGIAKGSVASLSKSSSSTNGYPPVSSHSSPQEASSPTTLMSTLRGRPGQAESRFSRTTTPPPAHDDPAPTITCEEREKRLRALDYSELTKLYTSNPEEEPEGAVFQGYLWKKSTSHKVRQHWNRRWFVLDGSKIFYIKEDASGLGHAIHLVCDVMLGAVRELRTSEFPFCFEIVYANVRTTTLQAEGAKQYTAWIEAIRSAIGKRLVIGGPVLRQVVSADGGPSKRPLLGGPRASTVDPVQRVRLANMAKEILQDNPNCADCGKSDPEWVSLNLGCLVCIECSGVHRSLGVHISKMRSLTLDDLDFEEYSLIEAIGNERSNKIWDRNTCVDKEGRQVMKPSPSDPENARYSYIRAKYQYRLLLSTDFPRINDETASDPEDVRALQQALEESIRKDDVIRSLDVLAHGGMTSLYLLEDPRTSKAADYPLHVAAEAGAMRCCTLLLLNGFDPLCRDGRGRLAAEVAEVAGHAEIAVYLRRKAEALQTSPASNTATRSAPAALSNLPHGALVTEIFAANNTCADCDRAHPEWVSLNLGCLICAECCAVHRTLGVHVSKIRSITSDILELEDYEVIRNIGNATSNAIWDCVLHRDKDGTFIAKPRPSDNESTRAIYIKAKYKERLLLSPSLPRLDDEPSYADPATLEALRAILLAAVEADDAPGALKALAHGAGVNLYLMEDPRTSKAADYPLHVAAEAGAMRCCTLLLLNGFDPLCRDGRGRLAAEVAEVAGHAEMAVYLRRKAGASLSHSVMRLPETLPENRSTASIDSDD